MLQRTAVPVVLARADHCLRAAQSSLLAPPAAPRNPQTGDAGRW